MSAQTVSRMTAPIVVSESGGGNPHGGPSSGAARMLVMGNSLIFSDRLAESARSTPISFDMISAAIDWLRDKPVLASSIDSKAYKEYQPPEPAAIDDTRLKYLPLGLAMLVVAGLGSGVWSFDGSNFPERTSWSDCQKCV